MKYILYETYDSGLSILINYLCFSGYKLQPSKHVFTDIPEFIRDTPTILTEHNVMYVGNTDCTKFLTEQSCVTHLCDKANEWNDNKKQQLFLGIIGKVKMD